ncbi:MAG: SAM-dependent chlorinase/fluorinase [Candidatus Eisenbacteria bacterium]
MSGKGGRVITLLTDFGEGTYVPSVKGVLLGLAPEAVIVDITHSVPPGAIGSAAHILSHTAPCFPQGTIHLAVVDPAVGTERLALIVKAGGFLFVGPDNGLFGEVLRDREALAWRIEEGDWMPPRICPTFHGRDLFARVAARLARGEGPESFGAAIPAGSLVPSPIRPPRRTADRLTGEVVWVDRFGNLITNLDRLLIEEWAGGEPYRARVGGTSIDARVHTFLEAGAGGLVLLLGSWETLEVAVAMGSASGRLGVSAGEPVTLERIRGA